MMEQPQQPMQFQQPWMNPMMATPFYANPYMQHQQHMSAQTAANPSQSKKEPVLVDEYPPVDEQFIKNEIKDATGNMMQVLSSSDNPKHRNCKLLKFLKKIEMGAYKFEQD